MKIGFCDLDVLGKDTNQLPNLEIMKLATYYKKLSPLNLLTFEMEPNNFEDYDIFYCFGNQHSKKLSKTKNKKLLSSPDVKFEGTFFHNGHWIPLEDDIERCWPNISIYNALLRSRIKNDNIYKERLDQYRNAVYLRIFYDGWKYPWGNIEGKRVYIYDYDLTSNEGWRETIEQLRAESGKTLQTYSPTVIHTEDDLKYIAETMPFSRHYAPPKFYLDIPEAHTDFENFFARNEQYLKVFIRDTLFIYCNKLLPGETKLANAMRLFDVGMFCVSKGVQLYPVYYDDPTEINFYKGLMKEVGYYFWMKRRESFLTRIPARHSSAKKNSEFYLSEIKEKFPVMYEKMKIERIDVKEHRKEWIYGER